MFHVVVGKNGCHQRSQRARKLLTPGFWDVSILGWPKLGVFMICANSGISFAQHSQPEEGLGGFGVILKLSTRSLHRRY